MSYYHLPTSMERGPGRLETVVGGPSNGAQLSPPDSGWTPELAARCGFVVVVNTARPADTPTTTSDRSVTVNGSTVTETWTVRNKTQAELDADTAATNGADLRTKANNALTANATFLAIGSPTNAQTLAQVQLLTKECNGIIRLLLGKLDSVANT